MKTLATLVIGALSTTAALTLVAFKSAPPLTLPSECEDLFANRDCTLNKDLLLKTIRELYPHLSDEALQTKLADATDPYDLYRSLVPLYFKSLADHPVENSSIARLQNYKAWIAGDAHPGNFSVLIDIDSLPRFTLGDIDDSSPGPLYADFLRFLAGAQLYSSQVDTAPLLTAYLSGLHQENFAASKPLRKLMKESSERGQNPSRKYFDEKTQSLIHNDNTRPIAHTLENQLAQALDTLCPSKCDLIEAQELLRTGGGSGGLTRYHVLAKLTGNKKSEAKLVVIEFKELSTAAPSVLNPNSVEPPIARIQNSLNMIFAQKVPTFYGAQMLNEKPMLYRPRWSGNRNVDPADYNSSELQKILGDEAYTLGQLHAQSLGAVEGYARDISQTKADDWNQESSRIAKFFTKAFKTLR